MQAITRQKRSEAGFTLVELLVGMLLSVIVLGGAYSVYRVQAREFKVQDNRLEAQQYAQAVTDLMVREIRNAGYLPVGGATCSNAILLADVQTLQFRYDANASGTCTTAGTDANEDITYSFDTATSGCAENLGNIMRTDTNTSATPQPLTDCNVPIGTANFSFAYYDKDSNLLATPVAPADRPNIKRVKVTVTVKSKNPDPVFGGQLTTTMTSNAELRNNGLAS
jgi:prepilin-type N-terminal cleavage/methylation domain-containing protein